MPSLAEGLSFCAMAKWHLNRPAEHCNEGEVKVAQYLKALPDDWTVCWGFFYTDKKNVRREGDFLILAPYGGVLVLEVKGGELWQFSPTGKWNGSKNDNPLTQLDNEWYAVVQSLKGTDAQPIYVAKALGLPNVKVDLTSDLYHGLPRNALLAGNEIANIRLFDQAMMRFFAPGAKGGGVKKVSPEAKEAFLNIYGAGRTPKSIKHFIEHTEARFLQQLTAEYQILDMLQDNRQLLVEGGCGSGKSWYALEQARRYAREGKSVLLLAYNRALTQDLRMGIAYDKGKGLLGDGNITVKNVEELASMILNESPNKLLPSEESPREQLSQFYDIELPTKVLTALRSDTHLKSLPKFDALVVDEGQDHDTSWHPEVAAKFLEAPCGWWSVYWLLLRDQCEAPMAIFYDQSQRPSFRAPSGFDPKRIRGHLSQAAYVRLARSIRYTRPLFDFLISLDGEGTEALVKSLGDGLKLPEGPEVETYEVASAPEKVRQQIAQIIKSWKDDGFCAPEEVLILHARSKLADSAISSAQSIGDTPLIGQTDSGKGIGHCSIHKAKGLDSKAVILIDVRSPKDPAITPYERFTLFMGASRARQVLAVLYSS